MVAVGRFSGAASFSRSSEARIVGMTLPDRRFVDAVRAYRPSLLVHCAGTASVPDSVAEPYVDFQRTVDVCAFVLETLRTEAPKCHFVLLSSAAVYGNPESQPITEAAPTKPVSPYGYHKMICELLAREASELHGLKTSVLRIFSAYGERQRKQVVFDMFRKFTSPGNVPVEIIGTGAETRDFVHANDVAKCVETIAEQRAFGTFNIASGLATSIADLAELVARTIGSRKEIKFSGERRMGDPVTWCADVQKLADVGFRSQIPLDQGLATFAQWFASQTERGP